MARKTKSDTPESKILTVDDLSRAVRSLQRRIDELNGFDIETIQKRSDPRAEALEEKVRATLAEIFGNDTAEYRRHSISALDTLPWFMDGRQYPIQNVQAGYKQGIEAAVASLESVRDLLSERLADSTNATNIGSAQAGRPAARQVGNRIFVVHGHDEAAKQALARYLERLSLEAVILHEQPNGGRTIIEKLEAHLDVDFAVILLTPDDVGAPKGADASMRARARQNVILELGLFIGALGRKRVCALYLGDLELPSDYNGVLFVPMDNGGGWQLVLAREMRQAGLNVDLNRAI
ncbi:MAG: nucleotide-binding protein [Pseudomonadota bacterium]